MKNKYFLLTLLLAATAFMATSCQKEEGTVTLGAEIQRPTNGKVYINDHTPCWHNGDEVYINNAAYAVTAATVSAAQIEEVTRNDTYRAIFPASIVTGSNISNSSSVPVTLPAVQQYQMVGSHQRVDVPMGAYLTSGSTLHFYNLCSIVRVTVSNSLNQDLSLSSIVLQTEQARLSGSGTAVVNGSASNAIAMASTASHQVALNFTEDYPATVDALGTATFDIVVPAFITDNVTIRIVTSMGEYFEITKNNVSLVHNTITTVTVNVIELTEYSVAELVDGPTFLDNIPNSAESIIFEYNSSVNSGILLSTPYSQYPIYGNLDGTTWRITTSASTINANPNCRYMFGEFDWDSAAAEEYIGHQINVSQIDFGNGFNTSNVTDMHGMFSYCPHLTSLDLSCFNTENVIDMSHMFANHDLGMGIDLFTGPYIFTNLNVSSFNTSNVRTMRYMFMNCSGLSYIDVSHFNTTNVTDMYYMFLNCVSLTNLDVSHFNTSNVTNMGGMFNGCYNLTSLDLSNFNTSSVTDMSGMFVVCSGLTSLDLSNFNTENVTDMSYMFSDCTSLTSLNLSHFDMSGVSNKIHMCAALSIESGACTITCPSAVENAIKEENPYYDPELGNFQYITGLPTSGVTFTWVRPTSK